MPVERVATFARLRPVLARLEGEDVPAFEVDPDRRSVRCLDGKDAKSEWSYDAVFGPKAATRDVFETACTSIVDQSLAGVNGTIFVYGQTSSGKTHTMFGTDGQLGLVHFAARRIFAGVAQSPDTMFLLRVSMMEIYNEDVNDLLAPGRGSDRHRPVREKNGLFFAQGLTERVVGSLDQVEKLVAQGEAARRVGVSNLHDRSSRSHMIITMTLESTPSGSKNGRVRTATLNMVDLAGCEALLDLGHGTQRSETIAINKSLSQLKTVITALASPKEFGFVSYRDSTLTKILKQSLGGNARTAVVCTVTPASAQREKSKMTLHFGELASRVKNKPVVNESANADSRALIKQYQSQISQLETKLSDYRDLALEKQRLHDECQALQREVEAFRSKEQELQSVQESVQELSQYMLVSEQLKTQNQELASQLSHEAQARLSVQALVDQQQTLVDSLKSQNRALESKLQDRDASRDELHLARADLRNALADLSQRDTRIAALEKRAADAERLLAEREARIADAEHSAGQARALVAQRDARISALEVDVAAASRLTQADTDALERRASDAERDARQTQARLQATESLLANLRRELEGSADLTHSVDGLQASARRRYEAYTSALQSHEQQQSELETRNSALLVENARLKSRLEVVASPHQARTEALEHKYALAQREASRLRAQAVALEADNALLREKVEQGALGGSSQTEIAQLKERLRKSEDEKKRLRSQLQWEADARKLLTTETVSKHKELQTVTREKARISTKLRLANAGSPAANAENRNPACFATPDPRKAERVADAAAMPGSAPARAVARRLAFEG